MRDYIGLPPRFPCLLFLQIPRAGLPGVPPDCAATGSSHDLRRLRCCRGAKSKSFCHAIFAHLAMNFAAIDWPCSRLLHQQSQGLWMCLDCGNIGCSRQQWHGISGAVTSNGHALGHYLRTSHPKSREISTGRIWNYQHGRGKQSVCPCLSKFTFHL